MTPARWRQIEDVYHAALARDAAERRSFVAEACAHDSDLEREVTSLLARASRADDFLEPRWVRKRSRRFGRHI